MTNLPKAKKRKEDSRHFQEEKAVAKLRDGLLKQQDVFRNLFKITRTLSRLVM